MLIKLKYKRLVFVTGVLLAVAIGMAQCIAKNEDSEGNDFGYNDYVATAKCAACHAAIYESHIATAHYLTGQPALAHSIKGSFRNDGNKYNYTPAIALHMEKRDSGFYQVAYFKGQEKKAMRFDIVIGSGVMGQSFLTWRSDKLFQLPITYYTAANQWSNSPGFPQERVLIDRPVTARCLECHISYIESKPNNIMEPLAFDSTKIIYGIDCQKCHGPGAKHVTYHTNHPLDKKAMYITNVATLSQNRQIDACALCHSGDIKKTKPSFSFAVGNQLSNHFATDSIQDVVINSSAIDVHGNQVGLLKASKCFIQSKNMTCSSCHNPHENQRGQLELLSKKCINCHNTTASKFKTQTHQGLQQIEVNCIDCHMPEQTSKSIAVFLEGQETPVASKLRTHHIAVYSKK
jgi:hypothetical protein